MSFHYIPKKPVTWTFHHHRMTPEHLGMLVNWLDEEDKRGAAAQLDSHYPFGGFSKYPISGYTKHGEYNLKYPGDPLLKPLASVKLRDEMVCFYESEQVAVFQPDGSFIVARFD